MTKEELYSPAQWKWMEDRWREGFSIMTIADWADTYYLKVRDHFHGETPQNAGRRKPRRIEELDGRKAEFYALWDKE